MAFNDKFEQAKPGNVFIAQIVDHCDFGRVVWSRAFGAQERAFEAANDWLENWKAANPDKPHSGPEFGFDIEVQNFAVYRKKEQI